MSNITFPETGMGIHSKLVMSCYIYQSLAGVEYARKTVNAVILQVFIIMQITFNRNSTYSAGFCLSII